MKGVGALMPLPAQLLRELLTCLKADKSPRRALDKRCAPRVGMRERIEAVPLAGETPAADGLPCWVRNLSGTGIGLLTREALAVGSEFVIPFHRSEGGPLRVLYRVTQAVRVSEDFYGIGGKLVKVVEQGNLDGAATKNRRTAS